MGLSCIRACKGHMPRNAQHQLNTSVLTKVLLPTCDMTCACGRASPSLALTGSTAGFAPGRLTGPLDLRKASCSHVLDGGSCCPSLGRASSTSAPGRATVSLALRRTALGPALRRAAWGLALAETLQSLAPNRAFPELALDRPKCPRLPHC